MKRLFFLILTLPLVLSLLSCERDMSAYDMLSDFAALYSLDGIIYSSECAEGDEGYIDSEVAGKIYILHDYMPSNYAVYLNSHADYGAECGAFVCRDAAELAKVTEMCEERMRLLSGGRSSLLLRCGDIIFYSTLRDRDRAEELWTKIIRSHT